MKEGTALAGIIMGFMFPFIMLTGFYSLDERIPTGTIVWYGVIGWAIVFCVSLISLIKHWKD
jgi:hypothetical protein